MLVLVIGDFQIPTRANNIPPQFKKLLLPSKMQHILCTGNLVSTEIVDYLRSLASDVHFVRGDCDEETSYPDLKVVSVGAFRIGIIHGHQIVPWGDPDALELAARQMNVDVLVSGHTHRCSVYEKNGLFFINPGSATGAFSTISTETEASFALLDVKSDTIVIYTYHLNAGNVRVDRRVFKKPQRTSTGGDS
ncbi:hypothetical protein FO519_000222 [Halicephalobus sp. NKZ332]|nr:hypothetical protein FO519_000222 [Halicephalobus sp. NKZ332]